MEYYNNQNVILILLIFVLAFAMFFIMISSLIATENTRSEHIQELKLKDATIDSLQIELDKYLAIKQKIDWLATYSFNSYKLAGAIHNYSIQYNLEANLLISIAYIESRFQRHAISSVGCLSYFQINPKAHSIDYTRIHEEYYNTRWGSMILVDQLHKYDNNELLALNGYNGWASYKNPYANNVLKIKRRLDKI